MHYTTIKIGGRERRVTLSQDGRTSIDAAIEGERLALKRSSLRLKNVRFSKLGATARARSASVKSSMIAFAERYGRPDQAERLRGIDPARLDAMEREGIIDMDEMYDYHGLYTTQGAAIPNAGAARIDRILSYYDQMMSERSGCKPSASTAPTSRPTATTL